MHVMFLILVLVSPIWPLGANPLPADPFIIVNKQTNELAYIEHGKVENVIKVGSGRTKDLTPEGEFTITVKATNPYYRKDKIEGGDPTNPLGLRWIGFDAKDTDGRIYGIHGTNQPNSIGKYVSNGCIRLRNERVVELYEKVPLGTKVWIVTSGKSFEDLAKEKGIVVQ
ncbi:L,D-transpeptidase [Priestia flexa]|uniref:L,D-transpeptidase n=1 Tax=Priestia flexa TaxID=86664 RepID=UPI001EF689F7|nr:L,D-transpeptidase [Priestia flexa]MCG7311954.1 L,D-transpeptidase [Priestia flexa]